MGAFSLIVVINLLNRAYGQVPTCTEACPEGFEKVPGLAHCYKLLVDLGPVSHDKAIAACGYEIGATVVTFDNDGDENILTANPERSHVGKIWRRVEIESHFR